MNNNAAAKTAKATAQATANRRRNDTISDMPEFYGSSKDTITAENLIMDVAKVDTVQQNLKMATVEAPMFKGQNKPDRKSVV